MPRKALIRTNEFPYHVISRSNHRDWFQLEMSLVWLIAGQALFEAYQKHPVRVHAFVLMSNHYHLILDTPNADIDKFMYYFNKNFSLALRIKTKKINKMFGGRYKGSLITNREYYYQVMKYVFLNPNKAGISSNAVRYPYSTLHTQAHGKSFPVPLKPFLDVTDPCFLGWIHSHHTQGQSKSITTGLRRSKFKYALERNQRKAPHFDHFYQK